ncbi:MAG: hypothetical protein KAG99_06260 [Bacteroidales bacterium]|nr:hypothetical protein [Bacteroidales bacterium]
MKKLILITFFLASTFSYNTFAQHLAAYSDSQHNFYVFDAGNVEKLEDLQVQGYQVGGVCLAYISNSGSFKAYHNGMLHTLEMGGPNIKYNASDYLLGYAYFDFLKVFDDGLPFTLSTAVRGYVLQDSLITWYDYVQQQVKVYYKGDIVVIEDGLLNFPVDNVKSGDNIIAYVTNFDNKFKIFYHGELSIIDNLGENMVYKAGRDIVGYMDVPRNIFKAFYKGEMFDLEYFAPNSFKVGDEIIAYVDNMDNFKLFKNGVVETLLSYKPEYYDVVDQVVVFHDQGFLKTYCNGSVQIVERYIPSKYKLDWNTIAYLDENRNIKAVQNCEKAIITLERVVDIELIRDLIIYNVGVNANMVYYFGQTIELP